MKRTEALLKLNRLYNIRHVMVEGGYISSDEFMNEVLTTIESVIGMKPPWNDGEYQRQCKKYIEPEGYAWERESEEIT